MSQQPQRQLSPEEREYIKSKTRSNNIMTWFAGLGIFGMIAVAALTLIPIVCFCLIIIAALTAVPTR